MALPRFITAFLFASLLTAFWPEAKGQTPAQEISVSFNYQQVPLQKILLDLEKRYSLNFSYSSNQISLSTLVTCRVNDQSLSRALETLGKCARLHYQIIGDQVVLKPPLATDARPIPKPYTQTLRGTVNDATLKTPLIGATVLLLSVEPVRVVSSGVDGSFVFHSLPIGRHTIKVTYLGFQESELSNILMVSGKEAFVTIGMEQSFIQEAEVMVVSEPDKSLPLNLLISSSVHTLRTEEINRYAGSRQDPSRMAANYAGVSSASDQRNDLIVRGNSPLGVLWRLEGVEIPNPNHFTFTPNTGGAFSLLNNNLLANSDFLTGAFPAEYGNRIGAVMDVKLRNGNNKKLENTLQLGLNGLEVVTEGPFVKKWGGSFIGSMRLFTFQPLKKIGVDIGYDGEPQYQDASFKLELPTPKAGKFSAWGIGGSSNITLYQQNFDTTTWGKLKYVLEPTLDNRMYAFGLSHTYSLTPKTVSELIVSTSGSQVLANTDALYRKMERRLFYYLRNYEQQVIAKLNLTHKFNNRLLVKSGFTWQKMYFNNQEVMFRDPPEVYETNLDAQGNATLLQGFLLSRFYITQRLDIQGGLYFQQFTLGQKHSLEPRVSVNYYLTDAQRVYVSAGLHSQTQPLVYYDYRFYSQERPDFNKPYNNLDFTRSRQIVAGYNYNINSSWRLKAETYFQQHYKVPVSIEEGEEAFSMLNVGTDYSFVTVDSVVNQGTGHNYGVELTAERFLKKGFYALGNLSLLKSFYTGGDGVTRPTTFSVGFISNVLVGKEIELDEEHRHLISLDLRLNFSGGRRIIPIDEERTRAESSAKIYYDTQNAYVPQLKNYFRSDIRFSYQLNTRRTTHWFYAAADNFLNTRNELYYGWDLQENKAKKYYQLGIYPYLGYRIQF